MSLFDNCPLPAALTAQPLQNCGDNFGQVVKIAFWQAGQTPFTASSILTAAAWSTATALTTVGKVVVTNYLNNFAVPVSAKVEQTSDTNINAIPELQRGAIVNGTAQSRSLSAPAIKALKTLTPFSQIQPGVTRLVGALITIDNHVIFDNSQADLGIRFYNFFASDKDINATLGSLNMVQLDWYFLYGWSDNITQAAVTAFDLVNTYPST